MTRQNSVDFRKKHEELLEKMETARDIGEDPFIPSLPCQLAAMQLEATLQVTQAIQDMQTAITAELKRFIRAQARQVP